MKPTKEIRESDGTLIITDNDVPAEEHKRTLMTKINMSQKVTQRMRNNNMQYIAGNPRQNLNGEVLVKPTCSYCGSGEVYTLRNGTIVCRRCGKETIQEKSEEVK